MRKFYDLFENTLDDISAVRTIAVGDFNIDLNQDSTAYRNFMTSFGLKVCNNVTTRAASGSILDHLLSSMTNDRLHHIDTVKVDFSDHNVLLVAIKTMDT